MSLMRLARRLSRLEAAGPPDCPDPACREGRRWSILREDSPQGGESKILPPCPYCGKEPGIIRVVGRETP